MYVKVLKEVQNGLTHLLLITFLIFNGLQSAKSFGKLRLRAFQPYHEIRTMSEVSKVAQNN